MDEGNLIKCLDSEGLLKVAQNSTRLVNKLRTAVADKKLYETHQILRTINSRFITDPAKVFELKSLLYHGANYLIDSGESLSGQDIASLFVESSAKYLRNLKSDANKQESTNRVHDSSFINDEHDICVRIASILTRLPDTEIGGQKFLADTLKALPTNLLNRELLHDRIAREFGRKCDFVNSRYHYMRCASLENAKDIAALLAKYHEVNATENEVDLFIAQFVMQYLCLQNPTDKPTKGYKVQVPGIIPKSRTLIRQIAGRIFTEYTSSHPLINRDSIPYHQYPLLNFTFFMISILDRSKEASVFNMLCDIYRDSWSRDPNYQSYLTRIGTIYLGIQDPSEQRQNAGGGGLFNNILISLFDGADDDDASSQHDGNTASSSDELD